MGNKRMHWIAAVAMALITVGSSSFAVAHRGWRRRTWWRRRPLRWCWRSLLGEVGTFRGAARGFAGHGGYGGGYRGGYGGWHGGYGGGYRGGYGGGWRGGGWRRLAWRLWRLRGGYGWRGGYGGWGWGWGGLGLGLYFATLPLYYDTLWADGVPYYYADGNYFEWDGDVGQYETVNPPAEVQRQAAALSPNLIAYPKNGQSETQQATDKSACRTWAAAQSGFDPAQTAATQGAPHTRLDHQAFGLYASASGMFGGPRLQRRVALGLDFH